MAKRKVSAQFRERLSEKLMDLGNLVIAGLLIGQFVSGREFSINVFVTGAIIALLCYLISYIISK